MTAHDDLSATDEELAARRDVAALYQRYARRLVVFISGLGVPERHRDDVHHDVWLRVCSALARNRFQGHFRGWLFQIARNLIIDRFRQPTEAVSLPAERDAPSEQPSPLESLLRQEELQILQRCLEQLAPQEAAVFRLRSSGVGYPELCQGLKLDRTTAYKLNDEAKRKLTSCVNRATR